MVNLLHVYEYYLLATLLLGALQIRTYLAMIRFAASVPLRWPELYRVLRENVGVLLTWPLVVVGSFTLGLWVLHVLLRRLVWPQADVSWARLSSEPLWLGLTMVLAAAMLLLDAMALTRVARFRPPRREWLLTATDLALRTQKFGPKLRRVLGWGVKQELVRRMPLIMHWTLRRTAEVSARLALGLCLWAGWALGAGAQ